MFYTQTGGQLDELPPDGLVNVAWALATVECCKSGGLGGQAGRWAGSQAGEQWAA
jgi:hypothetical protein